jgi:excisionase family DNA binding protein
MPAMSHLSFTRHKPLRGRCLSGQCGACWDRFGAARGAAAHLTGMTNDTTTAATTTTIAADAGLERLLTVRELSDYLGIPVATLYDWRVDHRGPKAVKLGHALRYPAGAVRAWLAEQLDG